MTSAVAFLETSVIYCDDNLHRLAEFPADCIDLIYLDPPFFSNRHYEVIWGDEAEVRSFEDRWEGGIHVYVNWMRERMIEMHRVLKPTGTVYLHCDWHAGHYLKVMMDEVFGAKKFRNEIVWCYSGGGIPTKDFPRKHDTILRYTKGDEYFYKPIYRPYSPGTVQRGRTAIKGKYFKAGLRKEGTPVNDWWTDVPKITSPTDPEKLGYPTQKPEILLDRIINASSDENAVVLDPFCGCGTTTVVAHRLKRQWIGIDISPTAVGLMKWRMEKVGARTIKLVGMPVSEAQLRDLKPFEFQNWVVQRVHGTHSTKKSGDMGIDGFSFFDHFPIQVKQSDGIGRNVVDNFETAVERSKKARGTIYGFSFTKGAYEEAARAKAAKGIEIELIEVSKLLGDYADLVTPERRLLVADAPLPEPRPPESRPKVEELVQSDRAVPE